MESAWLNIDLTMDEIDRVFEALVGTGPSEQQIEAEIRKVVASRHEAA